MTKSISKLNILDICKSSEKEEYTDTVLRENDSSAVRLFEYDLWKVAFELKNPESRH